MKGKLLNYDEVMGLKSGTKVYVETYGNKWSKDDKLYVEGVYKKKLGDLYDDINDERLGYDSILDNDNIDLVVNVYLYELNILKWNKLNQKYECPICGGQYKVEEIIRAWKYEIDSFKFRSTYCMDCGARWDSVEE